MIVLTSLTDNSWIIKTKEFLGVLFKTSKGYNIKTQKVSLDFDDLDQISTKYGKISYKDKEIDTISDNINGYPVKDKNFVVIDKENNKYSKKNSYSTSTVEFYAGYWSIRYPNGWGLNLCPKVSTIDSYEHQGPFRTKLECTNNNNILNTRDNLDV